MAHVRRTSTIILAAAANDQFGAAPATGNVTGDGKNQGEAESENGDNYGSALPIGDFDRTNGNAIAVGVAGETTGFGGTNVESGSVSVVRGPVSSSADSAWGTWVNYGGPGVSAIAMSTSDNGRPAVSGVFARNQNNAQIFRTLQDQSRAALTKPGAVRSYAEHTLPKAGR
jgi:hypothetical protein